MLWGAWKALEQGSGTHVDGGGAWTAWGGGDEHGVEVPRWMGGWSHPEPVPVGAVLSSWPGEDPCLTWGSGVGKAVGRCQGQRMWGRQRHCAQ